MNYKKSLLSLAAFITLSNTVIADETARYLPLTSDTVDSSWVLFGVNGFSTGVPSVGVASAPSSFTTGYTSLADTSVTDFLPTSGLTSAFGSFTGDLASVQEIGSLASLSIAVDITTDSIAFIPEEPVRTMYVKVTGATADLKLNYKASLEGRNMQILVGTARYHVTISQSSTWDSAVTATLDTADTTPSTSGQLKTVAGVLDFDFSNNPVDARDYNASVNQDTAGVTSSFYYFNAITQQWEVYQKNAAVQDFTTLNVGKAYWGRVDNVDPLALLDNDGDSPDSGLVLADPVAVTDSNISHDSSRYLDDLNASTLTAGWNMLSFNESKPFIRHAATGLVLAGMAVTDLLKLTDDSKLHSVTAVAPVAVTAVGMANYAKAINVQIESLKLRGLLPESFNIKAFGTGTGGELILLSDKKFYVDETDGTSTVTARTLLASTAATGYPYLNGVRTNITDLNLQSTLDTSVESVYGEYALMFRPLVGAAGTAADGDAAGFGFSKIKYKGSTTAEETIAIAGAATIASVVTTIPANTTLETVDFATAIDTGFTGTADMVILANPTPFTISDATYTRVFAFNDAGGATVNTFNVTSTQGTSAISTTAGADTATTMATAIDAAFATTGVRAHQAASGTDIVAFTTVADTFDVKDVASGSLSYLASNTVADNLAKGAISGVYSLDGVARLPVNQWTTSVTLTTNAAGQINTDGTDTYDLTVNAGVAVPIAFSTITGGGIVDTYGEALELFNEATASYNALLAATVHGSARHTFVIPTGKVAADTLPLSTALVGEIIVSGVEVSAISAVITDVDAVGVDGTMVAAATTGDNAITIANTTTGAQLVPDLKANPISTPNYAEYGPLYTMRSAGYNVRGMLKATTDMNTATGTANTSAINWDSIDITRSESEWFANNEFNLFNINNNAGYWVYLEAVTTPSTIAISNANISGAGYTYYFSNTLTSGAYPTENIMNSGAISVTIANLNDATGESGFAMANVGGEWIPLTRTSGNTFTGNISNYTLQSFAATTSPIDVTIKAVNGKGQVVEVTGQVTIDYAAPTGLTATLSNATLTASATGASNVYVFDTYIPELASARVSPILLRTLSATNGSASFDVCSEFTFGSTKTLRIVAADGTIGSSNLSNAIEKVYESTVKSAYVLSHTQGDGTLKDQLADTYDATCAFVSTKTLASENVGVSLATVTALMNTKMSFIPKTNAAFTQDVAWTSNYTLGTTGTKVQIQNTTAYAGATFYIEHAGKVYKGAFPTTQILADGTIAVPTNLTASIGINTTVVP